MKQFVIHVSDVGDQWLRIGLANSKADTGIETYTTPMPVAQFLARDSSRVAQFWKR
jgi:hypothetical protein